MKSVFIITVLCLIFSFVSARDRDSIARAKQLNALQIQIDKIDKGILDNELNINRLVYEMFLTKAEDTKRSISIFALTLFDSDVIYDTVPNLRKLNNNFEEANDALVVILKADRELQKSKDTISEQNYEQCSKLNTIRKQNYEQYSRLHKTCPDYRKARKKRDEALSIQNVALARFVLSNCHENGEVMPTKGVISDSELEHITDSKKIQNLISDGYYLLRLRSKLRVKYLDAKFNTEGL